MVDDRAIGLAIRAFDDGHYTSLKAACKAKGAPYSTVYDRYRGRPTRTQARERQQLLSSKQEELLVQWILDREQVGQAPNHAQVRAMASLISVEGGGPSHVGKKFVQRFLSRWPEVKTKLGVRIDNERCEQVNSTALTYWYERLSTILADKQISKDNIWNMDETGTCLGVCSNQTVLGSADSESVLVRRYSNREWCTSIECISPAGRSTTPLFIFKGKTVQQQWFIPSDLPDWLFTATKSAYTTNDIGVRWLREIFIPETRDQRSEGRWQLLILDGHKSHTTLEFMQLAYINRIYCYYLVAHASHILQPLDLTVFSSLKRKFRDLVASVNNINVWDPVTKHTFLKQYQEAREHSVTSSNCASGFQAAGIWPFNPSKGLNSRFLFERQKKTPTTPPNRSTTTTTIPHHLKTPQNHREAADAFYTVSKTSTVDRTVRTLFQKQNRAFEQLQFKVAAQEVELKTLRATAGKYTTKHKRSQPVNPNKAFVDMIDIQLGSNGPSLRIEGAVITTAPSAVDQYIPAIAPAAMDPFAAVIAQLQRINGPI